LEDSDDEEGEEEEFDVTKIELTENIYKMVKSVFYSKYLYTGNIRDLSDIRNKIKAIISSRNLPTTNNYEELLVIRSALDWKDIFCESASFYKKVSKFF